MRDGRRPFMTRPRARQLIVVALGFVVAAGAGSRQLHAAGSTCEFTAVDRVVAVGDVHGAYDRFVEILRAASLVDDKLRWSGGRTHLVQIGDVVDRGPDSLKALDLIERLQKEASRAGGAVHFLLGNHEVMRMLGDLRYTTPGEYQAFVTSKSQDILTAYLERAKAANEPVATPPPLGFIEMRVAFGQNGRYGKWLRSLDAVVNINGVVFVHGGISPAVAGMSCDVINQTVRASLTSDLDQTRRDPLAQLATRVDGPLWYRGLAEEPEDVFAPMVDDILTGQKARAMVVAHTVARDGRIRTRFGGKVILIDTGMQPAYMPDGRASALEIAHGTMTAIYTDRRDVLPAGNGSPK
jgi:hypothetical protein